MAISTYTELLSAVENWLARSDLTSHIPEFITLCEAKLNRKLYCRQMEQRSTSTTDTTDDAPEFISLPSDFQTMRRVRLTGVTGKPRLKFLTQTQMDEFRYGQGNVAGQPAYFTIIGSEMELGPTPDANYTMEMVYRKNIPALASNSTNWLLTLAPDAYLYGALMEAAPYIKDDERVPLWSSGFVSVVKDLNDLSHASQYNAGPMAVTPTGATP